MFALRRLFLVAVAAALLTPAFAAISPYKNPSATLQSKLKRYGFAAGHFEYDRPINELSIVPVFNYVVRPHLSSSKKVPVLVFLPGRGEMGDDLEKLFGQSVVFDQVCSEEFQKRHPCHVVAIQPQEIFQMTCTRAGAAFSNHFAIWDLLTELSRQPRLKSMDESRVYLCGLSWGGNASIAWVGAIPGRAAGVLAVSSTVYPSEISDVPENICMVFNHEANVGPFTRKRCAESKALAEAAGGEFKLVYLGKDGHNAWDEAWREESLWAWLFSKTRHNALKFTDDPRDHVIPDLPWGSGQPRLNITERRKYFQEHPEVRAEILKGQITGKFGEPVAQTKKEAKKVADTIREDDVRRVAEVKWQEKDRKIAPGIASAATTKCSVSFVTAGDRFDPKYSCDGLDATYCMSKGPVARGDDWTLELPQVMKGRFVVHTGYLDKGKVVFPLRQAIGEVSMDGKRWRRAGTSSGSVVRINAPDGVKFIRVSCMRGQSDPFVIRKVEFPGTK